MKKRSKEEYLLDEYEQDYKSMTLEEFALMVKRFVSKKHYSLL
tara:strand:+ start:161 stop:289 length:129 start_codon:yes stop_codon:yes gene_type:complete